jgi:NitT/TauT family transport system ATP-binding protein
MRNAVTNDTTAVPPAPGPAPVARGLAITAEKVRHGFERNGRVVRALWDLDVSIAPGEFVSIVGPSGCGKTTLLAMVGGLVKARSGTVALGGKPVTCPPPEAAYMLARDALLPWRTARQNVEFGLKIRGVDRHERHRRSIEWLGRVGLRDFADARIGELSQGMRQRVAIARTLALEPQVLLMDEPFAALDAQTRLLQQREFISLWERTGATVLFVTHDLSEAIVLSDRVIIMSHRPGRIVADVHVDLARPRLAEELVGDPTYDELYRHLYDALKDEVQAQLALQESSV